MVQGIAEASVCSCRQIKWLCLLEIADSASSSFLHLLLAVRKKSRSAGCSPPIESFRARPGSDTVCCAADSTGDVSFHDFDL
jgi:hypothetical protein